MVRDEMVEGLIKRLMEAPKVAGAGVPLEESEVEYVLEKVRPILMDRPMLLEIKAPTRVFGDVHGQYHDLLHMLTEAKPPSKDNQMLFLGDYVDRGRFGLEVVTLLFAYKIQLPDHFHLLRGNHEAKDVCRVYGFYEECVKRLNVKVWKRFLEVFDCLPVACVISSAIFCCHGGLSPHLKSWDDIRGIDRPTDVPPGGLLADLLWSDPDKVLEKGWAENPRGVSFIFARDVVEKFLKDFRVDAVIRAHQVVHNGFELFANGKMITIFSAPNFCGQFENKGCLVTIDKRLCITMMFFDGNRKRKKNKKHQSSTTGTGCTDVSNPGAVTGDPQKDHPVPVPPTATPNQSKQPTPLMQKSQMETTATKLKNSAEKTAMKGKKKRPPTPEDKSKSKSKSGREIKKSKKETEATPTPAPPDDKPAA